MQLLFLLPFRNHKFNLKNNHTVSYQNACEGKTTFTNAITWLTIILVVYRLIATLITLLHYLELKCVGFWDNVFEIGLYASAFFFLLPFIMCQVKHDPNEELITDLKSQAGAICVLLSWFYLMLHLKRYPYFGLYVLMYIEVLKTLFNVLANFFILIVAFALSFHVLLSKQDAFKTPRIAIVKTMVMMIGEMDFDTIFVNNYNNQELLRYKEMSLFIFFLFVILMTIVLMNLMVSKLVCFEPIEAFLLSKQ